MLQTEAWHHPCGRCCYHGVRNRRQEQRRYKSQGEETAVRLNQQWQSLPSCVSSWQRGYSQEDASLILSLSFRHSQCLAYYLWRGKTEFGTMSDPTSLSQKKIYIRVIDAQEMERIRVFHFVRPRIVIHVWYHIRNWFASGYPSCIIHPGKQFLHPGFESKNIYIRVYEVWIRVFPARVLL